MIPFGVVSGQGPAAGAAYPQVRSYSVWSDSSVQYNHDVTMPANVYSGDLLMQIVSMDTDGTHTAPSGWTALDLRASDTFVRGVLWLKVADGTEGGTTVRHSTQYSLIDGAVTFAISDWAGAVSDVYSTSHAYAYSTSADCDNLAPAPGSDNYLWFAVAHTHGTKSPSGDPSGYSNLLATTGAAGTDGCVRVLRKEATAASDDPGAFTFGVEAWVVTRTIAVRGL